MAGNKSECSWSEIVSETFSAWNSDCGFRFAAALAYYAVFSITPLLVIAISLAGFLFGQTQARQQAFAQLGEFIGPKAASEIESLIVGSASGPKSIWATTIGLITLLLGASAVFFQLKDALNTIWGVRMKPGAAISGFIRDRILSFGMVLAIGFLLTVSLLLTTAVQAIMHYMSWLLPMPVLTAVLTETGSFALLSVLFGLIYQVLPDVELRWRDVWIGAVVTGLLFTVGKYGISFYIATSNVASSFGAAGALIVLLVWIYYSAVIFFLGAEFTKAYSHRCGGGVEPGKHAIFVTREMKIEQGVERNARL